MKPRPAILAVALSAAVVIALAPPWRADISGRSFDLGYSFLFQPPVGPDLGPRGRELGNVARIDIERIGLELLAVAALAGLALVLSGLVHRKPVLYPPPAAQIRRRAERRIGELTREMEKAPSGKASHSLRAERSQSKTDALKSAGIAKQGASQYERIATIPAATFEREGATRRKKNQHSRRRSHAPKWGPIERVHSH